MKIFLAAIMLSLFALSPAARAQTADARAQILKGQLEGFLNNQKAMATKNHCKLTVKGDVAVEKAAGYYAYTLPDMTYVDAKGMRSEFGMVAINAVPQANSEWKITVAMPTPFTTFNPQGTPSVRTSLGSQNATGIWNEKLAHFTSMNASFGNVQISNLLAQDSVTIGAFDLKQSMAQQDEDAYTGTASATMNNVAFFDSGSTFKGTIPLITATTSLADRAAKTPMTKAQIENRAQGAYPDFFNIFAFMFGAPEKVNVKITGLDAVTTQIQQAMLTAPAAQRQSYLKGMLAFGAISAMGRPVQGDVTSKSYELLFNGQGGMTINGTDVGALLKPQAASR